MTTPSVEQEIPVVTDPDAPYGRRADGTPKSKPGRKPGSEQPPTAAAAPPRISAGARKKTTAKGAVDYRPGIAGVLQLVVTPLAIAGQRNEALAADAAALSIHAGPLIEAVNDLAQEQPAVASALDRLLAAGPYGALIGAVIPLAVQIMANHKVVPPEAAQALGAQDPADLAAQLQRKTQQPPAPAPAPAAA